MKILIIDDEKDIIAFLSKGLKAKAYVVDSAYDGEEGSYLARRNHYDLIVLDNNLPKMNGTQVLKEIRKAGVKSPVLALTVNAELEKKGEMFKLGVDDYLTKPFLFEEFLFIALLIGFFILIYKRKIHLNHFKKAALIVFLIALFSLIASLFFDRFFKLFHLIVFPQGNWQFQASSLMIQVYQQSFFQEFFVRVIVAAVFISLFLTILFYLIVVKNRKL